MADAYAKCGFKKGAAASALHMMAAIEGLLEACLAAAAKLPPGALEEGERAREKHRREVDSLNPLPFNFSLYNTCQLATAGHPCC